MMDGFRLRVLIDFEYGPMGDESQFGYVCINFDGFIYKSALPAISVKPTIWVDMHFGGL